MKKKNGHLSLSGSNTVVMSVKKSIVPRKESAGVPKPGGGIKVVSAPQNLSLKLSTTTTTRHHHTAVHLTMNMQSIIFQTDG
jgi:hypothetical protein